MESLICAFSSSLIVGFHTSPSAETPAAVSWVNVPVHYVITQFE